MDIGDWLRSLDLQRYEPAFRENEIEWEALPRLTVDDFKDLGVVLGSHRRRLLDAIAALANGQSAPRPTRPSAPGVVTTGAAERRQLTVMFCDLVGSTPLSARYDPEDLREVISAYHSCVGETVARYAGFVAKYFGDGVLVYFGYPEAHEDDAERAVRAGLAVIEAVGRITAPEPLSVRLGVASGLVVVGDLIGAGAAQERGVVGEMPNLAARLQTLAAAGALVIAESTRRQIGGLFEIEDLGPQRLAGFAEPQRAWRVFHESAVVSRFEALRSEATPLVGRNEELDLLLRRWQQAKGGEGRVVLVSGEPGIGKSRLTAALSQAIQDDPHTRLRYFCSPYHQDSALHPFITQLERAARFAREDTVEEKLGKLRELLAPDRRGNDEFELVAELLSLPNSASILNLSPQRKREMLFEALLHELEALARNRPVLMVFEDAHWIDPTTRELFDLILDRVSRFPLLLLATFRPELQHAWSGQPHVTTLLLNRLDGREGATLVERVAGNTGLSRDIVDEIVDRADGVPLFVEELTKAVIESGDDKQVAAVLAASPSASLSIPATLHASLVARLDRLGPIAKEVGQVGAVVGREFGYELIEQVAQRPAGELRLGLDRLVGAGLLFCRGLAPQSSYLFKHALVQDAAYGTLLRARRQELHARIGNVLKEQFPEIVDNQPEILAHHFTQAGLINPAVEFWRRAGVRSIGQSAHSEAAAHFEGALDLLEKLVPCKERDEHELELTLALAVPLIAVRGFGSLRVETCALRAKALSDKLRHSPRRFAAQRVAWNSCLMRQPFLNTVSLARELVKLAESDGDPAKFAVAQRALGYSLFVAGEFREAVERLERGIALADALSDREFAVYGEHPGMVCRIYAGQAKILMGFPETGAQLIDAAITHARHEQNAHSLAWALAVAAHSLVTQHEAQATLRFASEAIDTAREHRLPQWLALGERCKGWAIHRLGDFSAGLDLQKKGVNRWYETGAVLHTTHCEIILAESLLREGRAALARAHLDRARAHLASHGEEYVAPEIDRLEALLQQHKRASAEIVEECLANSLTTARRQGARLLELRTATTLARVLAEKNERHKAVDLLAPIYGWFTEGFETPDLRTAKALLEGLA